MNDTKEETLCLTRTGLFSQTIPRKTKKTITKGVSMAEVIKEATDVADVTTSAGTASHAERAATARKQATKARRKGTTTGGRKARVRAHRRSLRSASKGTVTPEQITAAQVAATGAALDQVMPAKKQAAATANEKDACAATADAQAAPEKETDGQATAQGSAEVAEPAEPGESTGTAETAEPAESTASAESAEAAEDAGAASAADDTKAAGTIDETVTAKEARELREKEETGGAGAARTTGKAGATEERRETGASAESAETGAAGAPHESGEPGSTAAPGSATATGKERMAHATTDHVTTDNAMKEAITKDQAATAAALLSTDAAQPAGARAEAVQATAATEAQAATDAQAQAAREPEAGAPDARDVDAKGADGKAAGGFLTGLQGLFRTLGRVRVRGRAGTRCRCQASGGKGDAHAGCGQQDCACSRAAKAGKTAQDGRDAGFTLIEVMGALVVGSLVFSFAAFGISSALESARVSGFNESLALLRMNIQEVYASSRGFGSTSSSPTDITSTLVNAGAVPQNWLTSDTESDSTTITHNFGGTVSVEGTVSNFEITVTGIPQSACRKIVSAQFENWDEVAIGGTTVTSVPPTSCLPDNGNLGVNSLLFTAH